MTTIKAPKHLRPATREWWESVMVEFVLEAHHERLLSLAAESYDRCQQAREIIDRDGLTVTTADGGLKAHPCIAIERDCRLAFARLLRELDLDTEPGSETPRPPRLSRNRG